VVADVFGSHLEAAAFLVSLLKACLILENKIIPPTVNLSVPSPAIDWEKYRLRVPTELTPLGCRSVSGRSTISLSGAGIGGSTGHVVIESAPARDIPRIQPAENGAVTLVVGGLSPKAVVHICNSIRDANISSIETMRSCAVTLSRRARQLPWRTYFTLPLPSDAEIPPATLVPTSPPPVAFIFSGQGPQNWDMGRGLFAAFPVFKSTILELDDVYRRVVGVSLVETTGLFVSSASPRSIVLSPTGWPVTITVSSIAMLQMALFDLLVSVGIPPSSLAGHSAGETAILYASGAGSKAMALEIAIARGQAMTATESADLGMASLACAADVAKEIISAISGTLEISCFNSPDSVALSGSAELLEEAITFARAQGIFAQRIRTMVPGHSSFMDKIKIDYLSRMSEIFARYPGPHVPQIPVFSTCTGKALVDEFSPAYFWDNCRNPVLFSPAISSLLNFHIDCYPIFLELSCHAVLSSLIYPHGISEKSVLCPMRRGSATNADRGFTDEQTLFTETLARITLLGYNFCDLSGLYGASVYKPSFIDHPLVSRSIASPKTQRSDIHPTTAVNGPLSGNVPMNELTHPLLAQHVINGTSISTCHWRDIK
jgi:acyl transferase domain-containing protein